jgi:SAM-dependent methyltransferase
MEEPAEPAHSRPDYGLDAPNVVASFLMFGLTGVTAAVARLAGVWHERSPLAVVMMPLMFGGVALGMTGLWMFWYSQFGKIRARELHLNRLPWRGDERVLDVGCGRGLFLVGAAKRLDKGGKAVGVDVWNAADLSGNSPDATLENARLEGVGDRVEVKTGDARRLPFPDGTFDAVVSRAALHNIYDAGERSKAVAEVARVLKPGGRVLIVDIRHTGEYAETLRRHGLPGATARRGLASYLATAFTFGALRLGVVTGRKSPPSGETRQPQ